LIRMKPFFGWGYVSGGRVAFLQIYSWWAAPHAHNAFLEMLLDLGIAGGLLLTALIWKVCSRAFTGIRSALVPLAASPGGILSLQILCLVVFLLIEGLLEAGFSGAPRFETAILFGC